ncbi:hypothetical protein [Kitasatospora sp. LaBMicrA B282]|uniref:hypothetical protein n=1 Tax=Kitasatospora sp. LaBMicrA B282 TaxID=3420949 RepID=UPI003D0AEC33
MFLGEEHEVVAAEGQVVDLNAQLLTGDGLGAWPLNMQLRVQYSGDRWVVCALARGV